MKKSCSLLLCGVLLLSVCAFGFTTSATEPPDNLDVLSEEEHLAYLEESLSSAPINHNLALYDDYLSSYYLDLTYNLGMNYKGSCGYVAIAMLLSYYDTFLNDSIIPEAYDVNSVGEEIDMTDRQNSPGILRDIIANPNNLNNSTYGYYMSNTDYRSTMAGMSNNSLHSKLITIASTLGYYYESAEFPAGSNFNNRLGVMNYYFQNVLNYDSDDYSFNYINMELSPSYSDDVRDFAITKVQQGIPVLLSIAKESGSGHVVVAYDYNEEDDELYCHFGWGANSTHLTPEEEGFDIYKTALTICFASAHSHSNNYGVQTVNGNQTTTTYHCFDSTDISLLHTHSYTHSFSELTQTYHKAFCECGNYMLKDHNWFLGACSKCFETHSPHTYNQWAPYSDSFHIEKCICGNIGTRTMPHVVKSQGSTIGGKVPCLSCGALVDLDDGFGQVIMQIQKVTVNGSYILPNGIIVLVDEDIEAYFNGTLVFYDRDELPETE